MTGDTWQEVRLPVLVELLCCVDTYVVFFSHQTLKRQGMAYNSLCILGDISLAFLGEP